MDRAGKLVFDVMEGEHMQFSLEDFAEKITIPYLLEIEDSIINNRLKSQETYDKHSGVRKHYYCNEISDQSKITVDWEVNQQQQQQQIL
ncbi:hypothetical protein BX616_008439 [Lobosporangium transversale]|nr:hypothetical protein BX616_008439 [Lobosporangium transversale]